LIAVSGDVNYNNVSLLLHFDGANGSTTFTDNSPNTKTVSKFGDAQISTTQSKFGGASGYFDGNGDYLTSSSSDFSFGSGDFTVEGWMYVVNSDVYRSIANFTTSSNNNTLCIINNALLWYDGGTHRAESNTFAQNTWHHFAVTRSSGKIRIFVNGTKSNTDYTSFSNINSGSVRIGTNGFSSSFWFNGYLDDIRITKGVARYTENFTPPTAAYPNFGIYNALASDPGPLGVELMLADVEPRAFVSDPGPLGAELILTQQLAALASAPSVLGDANPFAWHLFARADLPSVLGGPTPLGFHDFTGVLGDATTYYVMDLIGPSGTTRVPISSWQATLQAGLSNYVQCVVPAVQAYASAINAATQFVVSRLVSVPGLGNLTYEMARGPVQTATFDQGPSRYTCTLSGYSTGFAPDEDPSAAYNRTLQDIRNISINQGGVRVRCSIDWLLRPSMRVTAGSNTFIVSFINYYVSNNDAYMDVGERT
jgi:hypothetical protein